MNKCKGTNINNNHGASLVTVLMASAICLILLSAIVRLPLLLDAAYTTADSIASFQRFTLIVERSLSSKDQCHRSFLRNNGNPLNLSRLAGGANVVVRKFALGDPDQQSYQPEIITFGNSGSKIADGKWIARRMIITPLESLDNREYHVLLSLTGEGPNRLRRTNTTKLFIRLNPNGLIKECELDKYDLINGGPCDLPQNRIMGVNFVRLDNGKCTLVQTDLDILNSDRQVYDEFRDTSKLDVGTLWVEQDPP